MIKRILSILLIVGLTCCQGQDPVSNNTGTIQTENYTLVEVASHQNQWTGVAVSQSGRIFVNFPRWSDNTPISVAEINADGEAVAYPNEEMNNWQSYKPAEDYFVCVQSVFIDDQDFLWILDPGQRAQTGRTGAKLLKVDLTSNSIVQKILFDETIAQSTSYLNDIRVDTQNEIAYLTDSGVGAIIVIDLKTGISRRLLSGHTTTKAEQITLVINGNSFMQPINSDGLALDKTGGYLYYQALTGRTLYRIKTEHLNNSALSAAELENKIETVGQSGASDAIAFYDGWVYLTSIEENAIRKISPEGEIVVLVQDDRLEWPDSFSITADGEIYVTTSRIAFPPGNPYKIFKLLK